MENVKDVHAALQAVIVAAHEIKADRECPYDVGLNLDKAVRHATRINNTVEFLVNKHDICEDPNPFFLQIVDDIQSACEEFSVIHVQYAVPEPDVPFFNIARLNSKISMVVNRLQNFKVSLSLIEPISNHVSENHLRKVAQNVAKVLAPALSAEHIEALRVEIENEVNRIRAAKSAAKNKHKEETTKDIEDDYEMNSISSAVEDDAVIIEKGLKTLETTGLALIQVMAVAEKIVEPADVYSELKRPVSEIAAQMKRIQKSVAGLAELFECKTTPQPFFLGMVEDIGIICAEFLALRVQLEEYLELGGTLSGGNYELEPFVISTIGEIRNGRIEGIKDESSLEVIAAGGTSNIDDGKLNPDDVTVSNQTPDIEIISNITRKTTDGVFSPTNVAIIPEEDITNQLDQHPLTDICTKFEEIKSSLQTFDFNLEMAEPMIDFLSNAFVQQTTNEVVKTIAMNSKKKRRPTLEAEELHLRRMMQLEDTDLPDEVVFGMKTSDSMKDLLASESESRTYFSMGVAYYEGYIEKDYVRALHYFNHAYEKGEKVAGFYIGEIYYNGLGVEKDYVKAFEFYQVAAKTGDGESLSRVGWCLSVGHGSELNTLEAIRHYKLASEKKSPSGMYHYGHALFYGLTMEPNAKEGHDMLYQASLKRVARAKLDLAHCYECAIEIDERCPEMAYTYVKDAYDAKIVGAWKALARYNELGIGIEQDFAEAARLCKEQYEEGGVEKPDAQAYYGMCLVTGSGVRKDVRTGMRFIRSGCVANRCDGWRLLADCYRYGTGVEINPERAVQYYEKSRDGLWGVESMIHSNLSLGEMYEAGEGVEADIELAVRYYTYAADRYNAEAQNRLAAMYEEGFGVKKNMERACHYYDLASRSGHPAAKLKVQELKDLRIWPTPNLNSRANNSIARKLFGKLLPRRREGVNARSRMWNSKVLEKIKRMGKKGDSG